jgi:hypothetical protein
MPAALQVHDYLSGIIIEEIELVKRKEEPAKSERY